MKKLLFLFLPIFCIGQSTQSNSVSTSPMKGFHISNDYSLMRKPTNEMAGFPASNWGDVFVVDGVPTNGLIAWWNPNVNITLNGSDVSDWADITGLYHLKQSTTAIQPAYVTGARPLIRFTIGDQLLTDTVAIGIGAASAYTILIINQNNGLGGGTNSKDLVAFNASISGTVDSGGYYMTTRTGTANWIIGCGFAPTQSLGLTSSHSSTTVGIDGLEINRTSAFMYYHTGATFRKSSDALTYTTADDWSNGKLYIGKSRTAGVNWGGDVYDIIIWNRGLTAYEYASVFRFFKMKYNIAN